MEEITQPQEVGGLLCYVGRWADSKGHDRGKPKLMLTAYRSAFVRLELTNRW